MNTVHPRQVVLVADSYSGKTLTTGLPADTVLRINGQPYRITTDRAGAARTLMPRRGMRWLVPRTTQDKVAAGVVAAVELILLTQAARVVLE
ncbi:hypothetical protein BX265_7035 [Streptomyces sp. TLI_235]|nr:hypothetical protein [Streptomyces sp. TLI_235]PBC69694.1 hypothetical protein BX265_7035 [Streptomyces sp. TLI_235]